MNTDEDQIINALSSLSAIDERLGPYCGHKSTSKGITFKTTRGAFILRASFLSQIVYQPESLTKEKVEKELRPA